MTENVFEHLIINVYYFVLGAFLTATPPPPPPLPPLIDSVKSEPLIQPNNQRMALLSSISSFDPNKLKKTEVTK